MEKYSRKRGDENIVIEFRFVKKLFIILVTPAVLLFFYFTILPEFTFVHFEALSNLLGNPSNIKDILMTIGYFSAILSLVVIGVFLRFTTQTGKKEFRYYFAKRCCKIMSVKGSDIEKMKYLYLLLDSYNKYLRRSLKFKIKDIDKIYSLVLYADDDKKNTIMNAICNSLESNRLKLARFLSTIYKVPEGELFEKESIYQKLKTVGSFLVIAIPIVISIIQLALPLVATAIEKFSLETK